MASWDAKDVPAALMDAAEKADRAARREYIATAVLAALAVTPLMGRYASNDSFAIRAQAAVELADALIAELDRE